LLPILNNLYKPNIKTLTD